MTSSETRFPLGSETPEMKFYAKGSREIALSDYLHKKRIVILFVPTGLAQDAAGYLGQFEKKDQELNKRDLKIFAVTPEGSALFDKQFGTNTNIDVVSQKEVSSAGSESYARNEPLLILIGKDGTVKLKERHFVDKSALYAVIDAMPMRKSEMKREKQ
ncbi:unnamed protein product [Sphagnum balticum]